MPKISIIAKDARLHQIVRTLLPEFTIGGEGQPDLLIAELTGQRDCLGVKAIRKLRETYPTLQVVVISGGSSAAVTQQAVRLRVDDFFTLPAQGTEFRDSVSALVAGKEAPAKNLEQQNGLLGSSPNIVALRKY